MVEARLEVYFKSEHGDDPVYVDDPGEVDALLDEIASTHWDDWPLLLEVDIADSIGTEQLNAGVYHHQGVLFYTSPEYPSCYSKGESTGHDGELTYYYMRNARPFPADAQLPLTVVKQAVREFMASGGQRPSNVIWQNWT